MHNTREKTPQLADFIPLQADDEDDGAVAKSKAKTKVQASENGSTTYFNSNRSRPSVTGGRNPAAVKQFGTQFYNRTKRKRDGSTAQPDGENLPPQEDQTKRSQTDPDSVWIPAGKHYDISAIGLHEEIEDFFHWMVPKKIEHNIRCEVVKRLCKIISIRWPECKVEIFGSFRTGLYLPTSDIDLVILGKWKQLPIYTLHEELVKSGIPRLSNLLVLDKAAVPIVKMTDDKTDVKVDISFNTDNGLRAASLIKFYTQTFPPLAKLIYVLKQFLLQRNLNEVFTGGLSSYALILMAVSFLQMHPRPDTKTPRANLGVLLIEFFELYGRQFNYSQTAIRVKDGGSYVPREQIMRNMNQHVNTTPGLTLCIEDPLDAKNDVGRGSFLFYRVKAAFEEAYTTLTNKIRSETLSTKSLLSYIITVSEDVKAFRRKIIDSDVKKPLSDSSAFNQTQATGYKPQEHQKDPVLTPEDPVTPVYMPPSPTSNVTPHELPDRHYSIAAVPDEESFKVPSEPVSNGAVDNLDNMGGVSTATSASIASSSSCTDSDGSSGLNSAMSISPANSEVRNKFKQSFSMVARAGLANSSKRGNTKTKRIDRADLGPDWRSSDSNGSPPRQQLRADQDPDWRNHDSSTEWRAANQNVRKPHCAPGEESNGKSERRPPGFAATAVQLDPPSVGNNAPSELPAGAENADSTVENNNANNVNNNNQAVTNDNYGKMKTRTFTKKRKKLRNKTVDSGNSSDNATLNSDNNSDAAAVTAANRFSSRQGPQKSKR